MAVLTAIVFALAARRAQPTEALGTKVLSAQCSSFKNLIGGDAILVDERLVQEALDEAFIPRASVGGVGPATQG